MGIAPESNIISVKILDKSGQGNSAAALAGIQWIIDNRKKYGINIINLSIGSDKAINFALTKTIGYAMSLGLVVIAAAGNSGERRGLIGSANIKRGVTVVGSYSKSYDVKNRNTETYADILAPGENIASCLSPEKEILNNTVLMDKYVLMSGTSMATPMVSGAVALLLEKEPGLDSFKVKERLIKSAPGGLLDIKNLLRL